MITALFLIIAFFRRKRFLTEDTCWADRILYYFLNVPLTPIFGPMLFTWIMNARNGGSSDCVAPPPDFGGHFM